MLKSIAFDWWVFLPKKRTLLADGAFLFALQFPFASLPADEAGSFFCVYFFLRAVLSRPYLGFFEEKWLFGVDLLTKSPRIMAAWR